MKERADSRQDRSLDSIPPIEEVSVNRLPPYDIEQPLDPKRILHFWLWPSPEDADCGLPPGGDDRLAGLHG